MEKINRQILCIDLKSFFASVECVARGLDPFTTPLVVASSHKGAITLAVTPYLKTLGLPGRIRLYDIPKNIKYFRVDPRMALYLQKSKEVVNIYLDFVASSDLHIYSIDECFLDITNYLTYYHKTPEELAITILKAIEKNTGLTATCGIGPNMFLCKVAMDIEAKKHKNGIAHWTYEDVISHLWPITPLSKVWGIGSHLEKRLNLLGIYTLGDLAHTPLPKIKTNFGVIGEELWYHAHGLDDSIISNFKNSAKEKSLSHSQILFRDYYNEEVVLIIEEMLEVLTTRLRKKHVATSLISLGIGYAREMNEGFYHRVKLDHATTDTEELYTICKTVFYNFYIENMPIRKVSLSLGKLSPDIGLQLDLFTNIEQKLKQNKLEQSLDEIKLKFGKNSLLKASCLLPNSTIMERNKMIGGHHE